MLESAGDLNGRALLLDGATMPGGLLRLAPPKLGIPMLEAASAHHQRLMPDVMAQATHHCIMVTPEIVG